MERGGKTQAAYPASQQMGMTLSTFKLKMALNSGSVFGLTSSNMIIVRQSPGSVSDRLSMAQLS